MLRDIKEGVTYSNDFFWHGPKAVHMKALTVDEDIVTFRVIKGDIRYPTGYEGFFSLDTFRNWANGIVPRATLKAEHRDCICPKGEDRPYVELGLRDVDHVEIENVLMCYCPVCNSFWEEV